MHNYTKHSKPKALQIWNGNGFQVTKSIKHSLPFPLHGKLTEGHTGTPFILPQKTGAIVFLTLILELTMLNMLI